MSACGGGRRAVSAGTAEARAWFPRGLLQPPGSFRFSVEALLLASFPRLRSGMRLLDLGTGCGVVALGALCRAVAGGIALAAHGVDIQPELVAAANANALRLGFSESFTAVEGDLEALAQSPPSGLLPRETPFETASFDYVAANPPFRQRDRGRLPPGQSRLTALFETPGTLGAFCRSAALALEPGGRFAVVHPASRKKDLFSALAQEDFFPVRELPVLPREGMPPSLILVESLLGKEEPARPFVREPSLILHEREGGNGGFTSRALAFCPFLACNAGPGGR